MTANDTLARWIQLDDNLIPRAVLELPSSLRLLAVDAHSILGVISGDDGTEIVHLPLATRPPVRRP